MNVTENCLSAAQSAIAAYFTAVLSRTRRPLFCEVTLHAQCGVLLAESFQLGPLGLGQIPVRGLPGFSGFLHPFA
jgi:hypothetical protein